jgi:hypothetical protein
MELAMTKAEAILSGAEEPMAYPQANPWTTQSAAV